MLEIKDKDIRRVAEIMHDVQCHQSHTDQCGWLYEKDRKEPWSESCHSVWEDKARKRIESSCVTPDEIMQFISDYEQYKLYSEKIRDFIGDFYG